MGERMDQNTGQDPRWLALSRDEREKLLDKYRDINVEDEWWEFVYERAVEENAVLGIEVTKMRFSGFWSQGDGASFEGHVCDWEKFMVALGEPAYVGRAVQASAVLGITGFPSLEFGSKFGLSRYSHSRTVDFEAALELYSPYLRSPDEPIDWAMKRQAWRMATKKGRLLFAMEDRMAEFFRGRMDFLYRQLQAEYESLTCDEEIIRYIVEEILDDAA